MRDDRLRPAIDADDARRKWKMRVNWRRARIAKWRSELAAPDCRSDRARRIRAYLAEDRFELHRLRTLGPSIYEIRKDTASNGPAQNGLPA